MRASRQVDSGRTTRRCVHVPLSQQAVCTTLQPGTMTNALQIEIEKEWSPNHIQLGWKRVRNKWNIIPVHSSFIRHLPFLWNDHVGWCRIWVLHLLYFPRRLMCKHTRRWRKYWDSSAKTADKTLLRWLCMEKRSSGDVDCEVGNFAVHAWSPRHFSCTAHRRRVWSELAQRDSGPECAWLE